MKKLAILVGAFLISTTTFAQKATLDNPFSLEGSVNLNTGNGLAWQSPTIRARYFVTENIAVRASLGLGDGSGLPMSEHYDFTNNDTDTTSLSGMSDVKRSGWNAQIGAEYHLAGTDRLSPYFMLGVNFGGGSSSLTTENSDGTAYVTDLAIKREGKMSTFGAELGAGLDVYLIENLYVGLELGILFRSETNKEVRQEVTTGGVTTVTTPGDVSKMSFLSTGANAEVRLGWRF